MKPASSMIPILCCSAWFAACASGGDRDAGTDPGSPADVPEATDVATPDPATGDAAGEEIPPAQDVPDDGDVAVPNGATARVIAGNADLIGGRQAAGGVGDILLANDRVRFVIRTRERGLFSPFGGNLLDADRVRGEGEEGHDRFLEMFPMVGFGRTLKPDSIEIADDGFSSGTAIVRVRGTDGGVPLIDSLFPTDPLGLDATLDYILRPGTDHLEVALRIANPGSSPIEVQVGQFVQFGKVIDAFSDRCGGDLECLSGRQDVDWLGADGGDVSYGFTTPANHPFSVLLARENILLVGTSTLQVPAGGGAESTAYVLVGDGTADDVARQARVLRGATDLVTVPIRVVAGDTLTDLSGTRIVAKARGDSTNTRWVSSTRPGSDGQATLHLVPGSYDLTLGVPGAPSTTVEAVEVTAGMTGAVELVASPAGRLRVAVSDGAGHPIDAMVSLQAGHQAGWEAGVATTLLAIGGEASGPVLPGEYTLTVSKGFEYGIDRKDISIAAGQTLEATAVVARQIDTTGWISMDTHDHCELSIDSDVPVEKRVANALATGVEVVSTTDHDHFGNLQPTVEAMGVQARVRALSGNEISPLWGHTAAIGCQPGYDYDTYYALPFLEYAEDGTVAHVLTPSETWTLARQHHQCQMVIVAHPWEDQALFLQYPIGTDGDPAALLPDLDLSLVDGIEVVNSHDDWGEVFTQNLPGWFNLLNRGYVLPGLGGSDQHGVNASFGHPRNLVMSSTDVPGDVDEAELYANLKAGRSLIYGGPLIRVLVEGQGMGATVSDADGLVALHIEVQAPAWMDVDYVRVYVNGTLVLEPQPVRDAIIDRLALSQELALTADSILVVAAGSDSTTLGAPGDRNPPLSITNPIRVDVGGDGFHPILAR